MSSRKPFNNPFGKLKKNHGVERKATPPPVTPPTSPPAVELSDTELWTQATQSVRPLTPGHGVAAPPPPAPPPDKYYYPDLDALHELEALVSGEAPFDLADSDEFIEGRVSGLDPEIVRRLRRGDYAVQGHIDLHGMTREEAKGVLERFLRDSRCRGQRCVLVVHGRGIHSKDQVPILKDALRGWFATNRFGRHVLAFATARPSDGGAGALYVLLRRAGR